MIFPGQQAERLLHGATWDVVVAGAGAVGLAIGLQLSRAKIRVLVLECGPRKMPRNYQNHNLGVSSGKAHRGLSKGRLKAFGGTTRLWGGQLVAFGRLDIDGSPDSPSPWPIKFHELAPFYDAAYRFLGIESSNTDEDAVWRTVSKVRPKLGENLRLGMNIWLPQPDFTTLFSKEISASGYLTVVTDAELTKLEFDETGSRVVAASATTPSGQIYVSAPNFVLACGTLENVRMLLRLAATLPEAQFGANTNIGRGFIDHFHGIAGRIVVTDRRTLRDYFDNVYFSGRKYSVKIRAEDGFRQQRGISNCAATINSPGAGQLVRDLARFIRTTVADGDGGGKKGELLRDAISVAGTVLPLAWRYLVERRSFSILSGEVFLGVELEQVATAKSFLFLDPKVPPESAPIGVHWDFDGREMEAAAQVCAEIDDQLRAANLGHVEIDPRVLARDPEFLDDCHDANHHMGGAIMAASAEVGVVDRNLRVFGTDNLFVLGAATFPTGSFANPTLTGIALAMRLASHLTRHAN